MGIKEKVALTAEQVVVIYINMSDSGSNLNDEKTFDELNSIFHKIDFVILLVVCLFLIKIIHVAIQRQKQIQKRSLIFAICYWICNLCLCLSYVLGRTNAIIPYTPKQFETLCGTAATINVSCHFLSQCCCNIVFITSLKETFENTELKIKPTIINTISILAVLPLFTFGIIFKLTARYQVVYIKDENKVRLCETEISSVSILLAIAVVFEILCLMCMLGLFTVKMHQLLKWKHNQFEDWLKFDSNKTKNLQQIILANPHEKKCNVEAMIKQKNVILAVMIKQIILTAFFTSTLFVLAAWAAIPSTNKYFEIGGHVMVLVQSVCLAAMFKFGRKAKCIDILTHVHAII